MSNAIEKRWEPAILLFALALPTVVTWAYFFRASGNTSEVQQAIYLGAKAFQFALPVIWVFAICREPLPNITVSTRGLSAGMLFGFFVALATVALYFAWLTSSPLFDLGAERIRAKIVDTGIDSSAKYAALALFYSALHSLLEEYYWRWFVFGRLVKTLPLAVAIVLSSLGFMAHHILVLGYFFSGFPAAVAFFSVSVAVGGAAWAWLYYRSKSLWGPWASHCVVDAAIFVVGYDVAFS